MRIKPRTLPLKLRSITAYYPLSSASASREASLQNTSRYLESQYQTTPRKQRSKLHKANLRALRDFPHTLDTLANLATSCDHNSEYTPSYTADSIPTSGQSTPESSPEPISNEELFGFRARPVTPAPPTDHSFKQLIKLLSTMSANDTKISASMSRVDNIDKLKGTSNYENMGTSHGR